LSTPLPRPPEAVLLDLDGTLVDTAVDLARATNHALATVGRPTVAVDDVRRWIGDGARRLLARALGTHERPGGSPGDCLVEQALGAFLEHYAAHVCVDSRLYPGVRTGLDWLLGAGARLACVTNKPTEHAQRLLRALEIDDAFELVLGGDAVARPKPDPQPFILARERLRARARCTLVVGDSVNDVRAARAAGVAIVAVRYGYNRGADIAEAGPAALIDSLAELAELLGS
jgi:phosphoglycolate phosphatase